MPGGERADLHIFEDNIDERPVFFDPHDILGQFQLAFFIELDTAYNGGFVLDFELEAFFMRWEQLLEALPLTEKERCLLAAICSRNFVRDQNQQVDEEKEDCAICYETYKQADSIIEAPGCGHAFHEGCLLAWLEKSLTCPFCKSKTRFELIRKVRLLARPEDSEDLIHHGQN